MRDADALVRHVLREDRDVLKRLLTEDRLFIAAQGLPRRQPHSGSNDPMDVPRQWISVRLGVDEGSTSAPPSGKRSGILTHPAWLLAFLTMRRTNQFNAVFGFKRNFLEETVPDTPIGVDAKLSTDSKLTLRQKVHRATHAEYCWRCHQKMDPLGLPFEQFDDFGRFRTNELDKPSRQVGALRSATKHLMDLWMIPFRCCNDLRNRNACNRSSCDTHSDISWGVTKFWMTLPP